MLWPNVESIQDLIEHLSVLCRHNANRLEPGSLESRRRTGASLIASGRVPKTTANLILAFVTTLLLDFKVHMDALASALYEIK